MPAIVFHSGPDSLEQIEYRCCQLVEHLFLKGQRVLLHLADEAQFSRMDQLLWTFDNDSFVPHASVADSEDAPLPVLLSARQEDSDRMLSAGDAAAVGALVIAPGARMPPSLQQAEAAPQQVHYMVLKNGGSEQQAAREDFRTLQQVHGKPPILRPFQ